MTWAAWYWDWQTALWSAWLLWFFVLESVALWTPAPLDTATAHLRPIFQLHPLAWFLTMGVWLWLGFHFLIEGVFIPPTGGG